MRLLFITFDFLPKGSAEANLIAKLIAPMKQKGCSVDILTIKNNPQEKDVDDYDGSRVFRVISSQPLSLKNSRKSFNFLMLSKLYLEKLANMIIMKNPKRFLVPGIIKALENGLVKYNLFNYDALIPVCGYYETYVAAQKFVGKGATKASIVIYQIDPLTGNNFYRAQSYKNRMRMETEMSKTSSAIITTKNVKEDKKHLNLDSDKVLAFEFPLITDNTKSTKTYKVEGEIKCVFTGYLYNDIRNPEYALELFTHLKLSNIRLYIIGSGSEEIVSRYKSNFPELFEVLGSLPLKQSVEHMLDADILVNIGNNFSYTVPSKIFDYISTGKPIINFYKQSDCPTLEYLERYPNAISLDEGNKDFKGQAERLEEYIKTHIGKVVPFDVISQEFSENTAEYVAAGILGEITKRIKGDE